MADLKCEPVAGLQCQHVAESLRHMLAESMRILMINTQIQLWWSRHIEVWGGMRGANHSANCHCGCYASAQKLVYLFLSFGKCCGQPPPRPVQGVSDYPSVGVRKLAIQCNHDITPAQGQFFEKYLLVNPRCRWFIFVQAGEVAIVFKHITRVSFQCLKEFELFAKEHFDAQDVIGWADSNVTSIDCAVHKAGYVVHFKGPQNPLNKRSTKSPEKVNSDLKVVDACRFSVPYTLGLSSVSHLSKIRRRWTVTRMEQDSGLLRQPQVRFVEVVADGLPRKFMWKLRLRPTLTHSDKVDRVPPADVDTIQLMTAKPHGPAKPPHMHSNAKWAIVEGTAVVDMPCRLYSVLASSVAPIQPVLTNLGHFGTHEWHQVR